MSTVANQNKSIITAKDITKDEIGKYITGYNCIASSYFGEDIWRIFYADENNIYLKMDRFIPCSIAPKGKLKTALDINGGKHLLSMDAVVFDYNGASDIKDERLRALNKKYFDHRLKSESSNQSDEYFNMKAVAYMLDTSIWNKNFLDVSAAYYAIGGPTIEMLINLINLRYGYKLELHFKDNGYLLSKDDKRLLRSRSVEQFFWTKYKGLPEYMWIASPVYDSASDIYEISYDGYLTGGHFTAVTTGFMPVVCLKSDVKLKQIGDRFKILKG